MRHTYRNTNLSELKIADFFAEKNILKYKNISVILNNEKCVYSINNNTNFSFLQPLMDHQRKKKIQSERFILKIR